MQGRAVQSWETNVKGCKAEVGMALRNKKGDKADRVTNKKETRPETKRDRSKTKWRQ